jgi:hypothetical protein
MPGSSFRCRRRLKTAKSKGMNTKFKIQDLCNKLVRQSKPWKRKCALVLLSRNNSISLKVVRARSALCLLMTLLQ